MTYALIENGAVAQYPYSFAKLRQDNPDVSYPRSPSDERLADFNVIKLAEGTKPDYDPTRNIEEGAPALVDEVWTRTWNEVDASAEQIASRQQEAADTEARSSVKMDNFVSTFIAMTPAEVAGYIDANVTNLASAKSVIEKLALMVLLLARREYRD